MAQYELKDGARARRSGRLASRTRSKETPRSPEEQVLRCVRCNGKIAFQRDAITVAGRQVHTQMNPGGFMFTFGCYSRADGCRIYGDPSDEQCWFPGTTWQYACCASCLDHLGWRWSGEGGVFFGIILDRVR